MKNKIFALTLLAFTGPSLACSIITGVEQFEPEPKNFERKFDGNLIAMLPAPEVRLLDVTRGTGSDRFSCNKAGRIRVRVTWPRSSKYDIDEIGFYFRVVSGKTLDLIFPLIPVKGLIEDNKAEFSFVWLDGAPSQQQPLDLEVEVFAINRGQEIGKSARFHVAANGG